MLVRHSRFFAAALEGLFLESKTLKVTLSEDEPLAFELFVQWLYLGHFKSQDEDPHSTTSMRLIKAWILGDRLDCPMFQDHVMLHLIERQNSQYLDRAVINYVYNDSTTIPGSKLRRWLVHTVLHETSRDQYVVPPEQLPGTVEGNQELVMDILKEISKYGRDACENPWYDCLPFLREMKKRDVERFKEFVDSDLYDLSRQRV